MPLACCIGVGPPELTSIFGFAPKVDPRNVAIVGLRDVDVEEKRRTYSEPVSGRSPCATSTSAGLRAVMQEAIEIATDGTGGFHCLFDMDSVDPDEAPGVGTPVRGGLTYREAHLAMEIICDCGSHARAWKWLK